MMSEFQCGSCGNKFGIEVASQFRHNNAEFVSAVTVINLKCKKCMEISMVSVPHAKLFTRENSGDEF